MVWTTADVPNIATTFPMLMSRKPKIDDKKTTIANNDVNGPLSLRNVVQQWWDMLGFKMVICDN